MHDDESLFAEVPEGVFTRRHFLQLAGGTVAAASMLPGRPVQPGCRRRPAMSAVPSISSPGRATT